MAAWKPEPKDAMRTILIATNGSDSAHEALEFGLALAADQDVWASVVHIAPAVDVMPHAGFAVAEPPSRTSSPSTIGSL
jgi:nucleotide-binding universal stress UspA family protein